MSIILEHLTKRYDQHIVVDDVSVEIADGELFVLLGASGSGKSTVLRMIAGLQTSDEGRIRLHGRDVTDEPPQRRNVGMVFQNYSLFRHMTVADNIEYGLRVRRVAPATRAAKRDELLALIGLAGLGGRYPRQLSGGQQQRVAVARALAFEPSVLLLDEPFGALDVKIRAQLRQSLLALQRHLKVTAILVTHDQEEAFELADRIGVIEEGRLLEVGPPEQLYRRPRDERVALFLGQATLLHGRLADDGVRVGPRSIPLDLASEPVDAPHEDLAVMLRPEDLTLGTASSGPNGTFLGAGTVEAIHFLGSLERIAVRLDPVPGLRALGNAFGDNGLLFQIARMPRPDDTVRLLVGSRVEVGARSFHAMARASIELLVALDLRCDAAYVARLGAVLRRATDVAATVLAIAERAEDAEHILRLARRGLGRAQVEATFEARLGASTAEVVLAELKARSYDLTIVDGDPDPDGRRATSTEQIARRAPTSVLVIKGDRLSLRRILLCTAGGEPGKVDVVFGGRLARRLGAEVTLLYVALGDTADARIDQHLELGVQTLVRRGVAAKSTIRRGPVVEAILAEAEQGDHDLILVGGHLAAARPFGDADLAWNVLRRADRSVAVVRGRIL